MIRALALLHDPELNDCERALIAAAETGQLVDRRTGDDDPAGGAQWGPERTVRADLLYELLTGRREPEPRAVVLRGARIVGALNLEAASLVCPLSLHGCFFDAAVNLNRAEAPALAITGCHLPCLAAEQLQTSGNVELDRSTLSVVSLLGAHIRGQLSLNGTKLTGGIWPLQLGSAALVSLQEEARSGDRRRAAAVVGDWLTVDQGLFCRDGFTAHGELRLLGATIGGQLLLDGATLSNESGAALLADGVTVAGGMSCGDGFTARGDLRLPGAHVTAGLDFYGAEVIGRLVLFGAHVRADLVLDGATLSNESGRALSGDRLRVDGDMHFGNDFTARGELRLFGARVGGALVFDGATLSNESGRALLADRITVADDMFCRYGFTAHGKLGLLGATVGGGLSLDGAEVSGGLVLYGAHVTADLSVEGATLTNQSGPALSAGRLRVDGNMFCRDGFTSHGEVHLAGAEVGGSLTLNGATLVNHDGTALDLSEATVSRGLRLRLATPPDGLVELTHMRAGALYDSERTWPASLKLQGFRYDYVEADTEIGVSGRLQWLERDPSGYLPQPYEQLRAFYRRSGNDAAARQVAIARQRRRRAQLPLTGKVWNSFLHWTVGYGYRTWQAALWLIFLVAISAPIFADAHPDDITPARRLSEIPPFEPVVYTLDVLVPVVSLGQRGAWIPHAAAQWCSVALTIAGWALTTAVVAGLSGVLRRD
jgi:hypothetical protein